MRLIANVVRDSKDLKDLQDLSLKTAFGRRYVQVIVSARDREKRANVDYNLAADRNADMQLLTTKAGRKKYSKLLDELEGMISHHVSERSGALSDALAFCKASFGADLAAERHVELFQRYETLLRDEVRLLRELSKVSSETKPTWDGGDINIRDSKGSERFARVRDQLELAGAKTYETSLEISEILGDILMFGLNKFLT